MVRKHQLQVIAIGNGTACRETEEVVSELIADLDDRRHGRVREVAAPEPAPAPEAVAPAAAETVAPPVAEPEAAPTPTPEVAAPLRKPAKRRLLGSRRARCGNRRSRAANRGRRRARN